MNAQSNFKANLDSRTVYTYVLYIFDSLTILCIHMFKCLPTVEGGGTMYHDFGTMTWAFGVGKMASSFIAMENPPFLVGRYIFSLVDFPASYVSLLECKG